MLHTARQARISSSSASITVVDRAEAGRQLAALLSEYRQKSNVVVLTLPRGGVPVGFEIAQSLGVPLDVLVVRKLGAREIIVALPVASDSACDENFDQTTDDEVRDLLARAAERR